VEIRLRAHYDVRLHSDTQSFVVVSVLAWKECSAPQLTRSSLHQCKREGFILSLSLPPSLLTANLPSPGWRPPLEHVCPPALPARRCRRLAFRRRARSGSLRHRPHANPLRRRSVLSASTLPGGHEPMEGAPRAPTSWDLVQNCASNNKAYNVVTTTLMASLGRSKALMVQNPSKHVTRAWLVSFFLRPLPQAAIRARCGSAPCATRVRPTPSRCSHTRPRASLVRRAPSAVELGLQRPKHSSLYLTLFVRHLSRRASSAHVLTGKGHGVMRSGTVRAKNEHGHFGLLRPWGRRIPLKWLHRHRYARKSLHWAPADSLRLRSVGVLGVNLMSR